MKKDGRKETILTCFNQILHTQHQKKKSGTVYFSKLGSNNKFDETKEEKRRVDIISILLLLLTRESGWLRGYQSDSLEGFFSGYSSFSPSSKLTLSQFHMAAGRYP